MYEIMYIITIVSVLLFYLGLKDIKTREVPNNVLIPLLLICLFSAFITSTLYLTLISFILMFIICLLLHRLHIGGGDLKLILILTIMLNIKAFYILGMAGGIYLILNRNKKETRPFVPYIFLAYAIITSLYLLGVL